MNCNELLYFPLEDVLMISVLQDWCDKDKFIRQRWTTICTERGLAAERPGESKLENLPGNSLTSVLSAVFDEFVHGQDRYISRLVLYPGVVHSHWSRNVEACLSLVESVALMP